MTQHSTPNTLTEERQPTVDASDLATNVELSANYHPTQRRVRYRKSVDHTIRHGVRSMMRSVARRDDFDLPDLATLADLATALDEALEAAAHNLRDQGYSWGDIARELGMTRQAAHKRWS